MNPDHEKAKETFKKSKKLIQKKEEGNAAFKSGEYQAACDLYTEALTIDPHNKLTNAKLYNNRATVCSKLGKLDEVIDDCTKAVELDEKYTKAFARRAKTYTSKDMYEEALRDYETVMKLDPTRENKQAVSEAKLELKKSKRKDYYKILGVEKDVPEDQLKKAYRKRAMLHHPDRHSNDSAEKQKEEEQIFKDVGEAYAVLSDPRKKARYDSGVDLEEDGMGGGGFSDLDASNIFQMFFGGGGGGFGGGAGGFGGGADNGFGGFGGHGHSHGHSHGGHNFHQRRQQQRGGFPGGFQFQF